MSQELLKPDHQVIEEANKLIFVHQYEKAFELLRSDLSKNKSYRDLIHLRMIELAIKLNTLEQLKKIMDKVAKKLDPILYQVSMSLIQLHESNQNSQPVLDQLQKTLNDLGPSPYIFYALGYGYESIGDMDRALKNYQESLKYEKNWYPSYFGLSQVYYHLGNEPQGDQYFYLFESFAPYNVYGNYETHKNLCEVFIKEKRFSEAKEAVSTLVKWWLEQNGSCPPEVQVFEHIMHAKINMESRKQKESKESFEQAKKVAQSILNNPEEKDSVLLYVARLFEDFGDLNFAILFYKQVVLTAAKDPLLAQKVGAHLLGKGEYAHALQLFEIAYEKWPDHPDIRFCKLISKLKIKNINIEEYLMTRDQLKKGSGSQDRVEVLSALHKLLAMFDEDSDVHADLGDIYLKLNSKEKAAKHFERMYEVDPKSSSTCIKYASYLIFQKNNFEKASSVLKNIIQKEFLAKEIKSELHWLQMRLFVLKKDYQAALEIIHQAKMEDPWNTSYLMMEIICLTQLKSEGQDQLEKAFYEFLENGNFKVDWKVFDEMTQQVFERHHLDLAYHRSKLSFLFHQQEEEASEKFIHAALQFDPKIARSEMLRLLNTNYDSANIYWALGLLSKELWNLQNAIMWFEEGLRHHHLRRDQKNKLMLELADTLVWNDQEFKKAIELCKTLLEQEIRPEMGNRLHQILAHAYLKLGEVRKSELFLEQAEKSDSFESQYILGLISYRNGHIEAAKKIWKPLISLVSNNIKEHNIKQEILKFYFDKAPYFNVS